MQAKCIKDLEIESKSKIFSLRFFEGDVYDASVLGDDHLIHMGCFTISSNSHKGHFEIIE